MNITTNVFVRRVNRLIGCGSLSAGEFLFGVVAMIFFGLTLCWLVAVQASPDYLLPRPLSGVSIYILGIIMLRNCQWVIVRMAGYFFLPTALGYFLAPVVGSGIRSLIPDAIYMAMLSLFLIMLFALALPKFFRHHLAPFATALVSSAFAGVMMLALDLKLPSFFSWLLVIIFIWHVAVNMHKAARGVPQEFGNVTDVAAEVFLQPFNWILGRFRKERGLI